MGQTIIGIFDSSEEARQAESQLLADGFDTSKVVGFYRQGGDGQNANRLQSSEYEEEDTVKNYLHSLFGNAHHHYLEKFTQIATPTGSMVSVRADSPEEASRAARILNAAGATQVDDNVILPDTQ
ncbi:hypothetical protein [Telluribacter sp. SYSU D00476]|uniref:hypothetical protein n=1 Tax=Telluribacter sp. SYSU D00476 TaxID=2811430 RepID=UPI001FF1AA0C|nr:hypothetical protein [Telluribacter sp. SYSU D00476]